MPISTWRWKAYCGGRSAPPGSAARRRVAWWCTSGGTTGWGSRCGLGPAGLGPGPGLEERTDVGPLINEDARKKVEYSVGVARQDGARVLIGGERATGAGLERGWFYQPTVLAGGTPGTRGGDRKSTRLNYSHR